MQETLLTANSPRHENAFQVIQSYFQLTKPRIILLLLITTAGGMWIAADGQVHSFLLLITIISGAFAAGSANTINCLYDRDIDYIMERTRHRPLPSGRVQPMHALIFAIVLATLSFTLLTVFANLLSACLAMSGIVFYCHRGCSWSNSSPGGLGGCYWRSQLGRLGTVRHYLYVDASPFLGTGDDDSRRLRQSWSSHAACD
jgi:heme O synthase-like polyprenyltransferase